MFLQNCFLANTVNLFIRTAGRMSSTSVQQSIQNLHELGPVTQVFLHMFRLAQSGAALAGLVLDVGPAGFQLLQPVSHSGSGPRLPPAQSQALLSAPGHLI